MPLPNWPHPVSITTAATAAISETVVPMRGYQPVPYHVASDETVACPGCGRMDAPDANYCDQCDHPLRPTAKYSRGAEENVQCPECQLYNDDDAEFCDQCGVRLEGRPDVVVAGENPAAPAAEPADGGDDGELPMHMQQMNSADQAKKENLVRSGGGSTFELRSSADGQTTQAVGIFAEYNSWYEIDSWYEGQFMERIAPGAFDSVIAKVATNPESVRVLYDHGMDPQLGNKPLGRIASLTDSAEGPRYVVDLLDTDYNRNFVIPALEGRTIAGARVGSQLGASMRFVVEEDQWNMKPEPSRENPAGIPERTILRSDVLEFGPVTFPANPGATAGARSRTDEWLSRLRNDPVFYREFEARVGERVASRVLRSIPEDIPDVNRESAELEQRAAVLRRRAAALLALSPVS